MSVSDAISRESNPKMKEMAGFRTNATFSGSIEGGEEREEREEREEEEEVVERVFQQVE